jgi:hypothetical protein
MTVKQVSAPPNLFCRSGHTAPPIFQTGPTKFFSVNSDVDPNVNGVYCEPCLIVAHAMAAKNRR